MRVLVGPARSRAWCAAGFLLFAVCAGVPVGVKASGGEHSASAVLSKRSLNPPVRSEIRQLRFSPDANYILVQDAVGIYILSRQPLSETLWIPAAGVLPAVFTPDSRHLVIASPQLTYAQVSALAPENSAPQTIPNPEGCLAAALSENGTMLGCLSSTGILKVFVLPGAKQIFSTQVPFTIDGMAAPGNLTFLAQIAASSAFSEPIGDFRANRLAALAGRANPARILFSPDGRYVVAGIGGPDGTAVGADLSIPRKISVPGELARHLLGNPVFISDSETAAVDSTKPQSSAVFSFPEGRTVQPLPVSAHVTASTNGQYLFLAASDGGELQIFDARTGKAEGTISARQADIAGDELAACDAEGNITLSTLGATPHSQTTLSVGPISDLRIAASSPDLSLLALSVGAGADIFSASTGERLAVFPSATAAWCGDDTSCYVAKPAAPPKMLQIERWVLGTAQKQPTSTWFLQDMDSSDPFQVLQVIPSGPAVLEYAPRMLAPMAPTMILGPGGVSIFGSPFRPGLGIHLRSLNMSDGRQVWQRQKDDEAPIPFSDPQGDRVVLGWSARSRSGHEAAKRYPAAYDRLKRAKLSPYDTFFEVLDDRTGNSVGGTLVQVGSGAMAFDSAFSEGDWLILTKDGQRVLVVSLKTGETKLTLFGQNPSLSAAGDLVSLLSSPTQVTVYDLTTLAQLAAYDFAAPIAYTRFSADGKRLLVLTTDQTVRILNAAAGAAPVAAN